MSNVLFGAVCDESRGVIVVGFFVKFSVSLIRCGSGVFSMNQRCVL